MAHLEMGAAAVASAEYAVGAAAEVVQAMVAAGAARTPAAKDRCEGPTPAVAGGDSLRGPMGAAADLRDPPCWQIATGKQTHHEVVTLGHHTGSNASAVLKVETS